MESALKSIPAAEKETAATKGGVVRNVIRETDDGLRYVQADRLQHRDYKKKKVPYAYGLFRQSRRSKCVRETF